MSATPHVPHDVDAAALPNHGFGVRAPIWWAIVLLVLMELTMFVLLFASTLFVRENFVEWPTKPDPPLAPCVVAMALGVASLVPTVLAARRARRKELGPTRRAMLLATALSAAWLGARVWEMATLPWTWMADAHASCVWVALGLHALEIAVGTGEAVFLCVLLVRGPLEDHHYIDVDANALFWSFVVAVWVPFHVLFFLAGRGP